METLKVVWRTSIREARRVMGRGVMTSDSSLIMAPNDPKYYEFEPHQVDLETAHWCGGIAVVSGSEVGIEMPAINVAHPIPNEWQKSLIADKGDWIVSTAEGRFRILSDKSFSKLFVEVCDQESEIERPDRV